MAEPLNTRTPQREGWEMKSAENLVDRSRERCLHVDDRLVSRSECDLCLEEDFAACQRDALESAADAVRPGSETRHNSYSATILIMARARVEALIPKDPDDAR